MNIAFLSILLYVKLWIPKYFSAKNDIFSINDNGITFFVQLVWTAKNKKLFADWKIKRAFWINKRKSVLIPQKVVSKLPAYDCLLTRLYCIFIEHVWRNHRYCQKVIYVQTYYWIFNDLLLFGTRLFVQWMTGVVDII